jgi:hypothetical protein
VVTVHLWTVPAARVPGLLARTTRWRRSRPGADFVKLLGTTRTGRFDLRGTDPRRWLLLACWPDDASAARFEDGPLARRWRAAAVESWRACLVPLASHGRWAGRSPFTPAAPAPVAGPVLVLTRARLRWRNAGRFWRAMSRVRPAGSPGARFGLGIGEAPVGWQGTVSVWDSAAALEAFAYRDTSHLAAMRGARTEDWYAEELFARFAIRDAVGTVDGRDPMA